MPVSRRTTERLAERAAGVYADAERQLLQLIASYLARDAEAPAWAEAKLAELQTFRKRVERIVQAAQAEARAEVRTAAERAYMRGTAAAEGELQDGGVSTDAAPRHAEYAVEALVAAQERALEDLQQHVVRQTTDAYQAAVAKAAGVQLTGAQTRLQAAQQVLDELAAKGVSAPRDSAGRRWELASYVEMATRTTAARASVEGHLDRLEDAGLPLVIVSDSPRECELCRPWEGKVLARGPVPTIVRNARTGERMAVEPDGTVAEAMAAGLMHPNCTHNLSAFIPGATRNGRGDANAEGYEARQQLRYYERKVREWKRREAAAMTPEAQRKARRKVRGWQERIREHVDANPGLLRQRQREQITRAR